MYLGCENVTSPVGSVGRGSTQANQVKRIKGKEGFGTGDKRGKVDRGE